MPCGAPVRSFATSTSTVALDGWRAARGSPRWARSCRRTLGAGDSARIETDWAFRRDLVRGVVTGSTWSGMDRSWQGLLCTSIFSVSWSHRDPHAERVCAHRLPTRWHRLLDFARVAHRAFLTGPSREFLLVSDMLNPVVLAGWLQRFPDRMKMSPPEFGVESDELRHLAQEIAERLYPWAEYDPETSVLRAGPRRAWPRCPSQALRRPDVLRPGRPGTW